MKITGKLLARIGISFLVGAPAPSQSLSESTRNASRLHDLVNEGEYAQAILFANKQLNTLHMLQRDDLSVRLRIYLSEAALEIGHIGDAGELLNDVDRILNRTGGSWDAPILERERAALQLARGEYDAAAITAAKARRLSIDHDFTRITVGYCQSLQALALMRTGKASEAEDLLQRPLKDCPKKPGKYFVFAPRILFTACLVEGHLGKFAEAQALCQRGLEMAQESKRETRDLELAYLASAEAYLEAGALAMSRDAATHSALITARLFGEKHQDLIAALHLLAQVSVKEGKIPEACDHATRAAKLATDLFGADTAASAGPIGALSEMKGCTSPKP